MKTYLEILQLLREPASSSDSRSQHILINLNIGMVRRFAWLEKILVLQRK